MNQLSAMSESPAVARNTDGDRELGTRAESYVLGNRLMNDDPEVTGKIELFAHGARKCFDSCCLRSRHRKRRCALDRERNPHTFERKPDTAKTPIEAMATQ